MNNLSSITALTASELDGIAGGVEPITVTMIVLGPIGAYSIYKIGVKNTLKFAYGLCSYASSAYLSNKYCTGNARGPGATATEKACFLGFFAAHMIVGYEVSGASDISQNIVKYLPLANSTATTA